MSHLAAEFSAHRLPLLQMNCASFPPDGENHRGPPSPRSALTFLRPSRSVHPRPSPASQPTCMHMQKTSPLEAARSPCPTNSKDLWAGKGTVIGTHADIRLQLSIPPLRGDPKSCWRCSDSPDHPRLQAWVRVLMLQGRPILQPPSLPTRFELITASRHGGVGLSAPNW